MKPREDMGLGFNLTLADSFCHLLLLQQFSEHVFAASEGKAASWVIFSFVCDFKRLILA